jgi:enamine deaminase RidA (YjgF/YER057c/UK114 family)
MRKVTVLTSLFAVLASAFIISGCGTNEAKIRELARDEATKAIEVYKASFAPEKMGFGVAWEKSFSYSEGTKVGNMIFIAGQFAHSTDVDSLGMPKEDLMTGKNFEQQFRTTLENMKKVLANYGATMDDVVFLQNFVVKEAGKNKAGDYNKAAAPLICEYFPKGLQGMTIVEVSKLYGAEQLVESNAIAVISPKK